MTRRRMTLSIASIALVAGFTSALHGDDRQAGFPSEIVCWEPIAANPLFAGAGGDAWDAEIRERGWILREPSGRYRLWYTGYNEERSPTKFLGHATSSDGISWKRDPRNPIYAEGWVEDMCVIRHEGVYYMFAEGRNDVAHLLTSGDGIDWDEQGPLDVRLADGSPIPPGPYGTPTVLIKDGVWHLFYERRDQGVWSATSTDLKTWTNVQDAPVLAMGPADYDKAAVALNDIIEYEGVYYGVYHANATRPWSYWSTCIARSGDLIHWEKYAGNPVIKNNSSSGIFVETPDGLILYTMHPVVRRYEHPGEAVETRDTE